MIKTSQIDDIISDNINHLDYTRKFAIESLDKIQYVEYNLKGKVITVPTTNLPKHTNEILEALGMQGKVTKKKFKY